MLILEIDTHSPVPIYEQIVDGIHRLVSSGHLVGGATLPSVRQLAGDLEVNPNTVARAYRTLERNGVLETAGRRGTRVAPEARDQARQALLRRLDEAADRIIRETVHLGMDPTDLLAALAQRLGISPGDLPMDGRTT